MSHILLAPTLEVAGLPNYIEEIGNLVIDAKEKLTIQQTTIQQQLECKSFLPIGFSLFLNDVGFFILFFNFNFYMISNILSKLLQTSIYP